MAQSSIQYLNHVPFFTFLTGILDSEHFAGQSTIKLLEIGCGSGRLAYMLKQHYKDRVNIVAIDPSEDGIKQARELTETIEFLNSGILELDASLDGTFDLLFFTKSLHHCDPLDKSIERAYALLKQRGVFVAEEFNQEIMDEKSATWSCQRMDLLRAAGVLGHVNDGRYRYRDERHEEGDQEPLQDLEHIEPHWIKFMDPNVSPLDSWNSFYKLHPMPSVPTMVKEVGKVFGDDTVRTTPDLPFLHNVLMGVGLIDSPVGRSVMTALLAQEESAIRNGTIIGMGVNIVAEKK